MVTLHKTISDLCLKRLGRLPNLDSPTGYNDKIQWLKLYDQMAEQVVCCDKIKVRGFITLEASEKHLVPVIQIADKFDEISFADKIPCVVKTNHDSGSVCLVRSEKDIAPARERIEKGLGRAYGVEKGEWAYSFIKPRIIVERMLREPIIDYKFHCCNGTVKWVQIIRDRQSGKPKETICDRFGEVLSLHMDHKMIHSTDFEPDNSIIDALVVAEKLSEKFRYVRVDTYIEAGKVYVGELTFWPLSGCYLSEDEPIFGEMLDFDMSFKRPMILR